MKSTLFKLFSLLFLTYNISSAQEVSIHENSLKINGQFRPRLEIRDGVFKPKLNNSTEPAALISDRIRLSFEYSYNNILTFYVAPQSVGIWGQANMVQGAENSGSKIAIFEAWSKIKLADNWNIKAGRQVISLDDERIFGELDWAQGGRTHDALSINFIRNKFELRSFFAFNQNYKMLYGNNLSNTTGSLYSTSDALPYKWMQTLWFNIPITDNSKLTLLGTNLGFQNALTTTKDTATHFSQTFGGNYFYKNDRIDWNITGYYQTGKNNAGVNTQAFLAAAAIGYTFDKKTTIGLGTDYVSGNDVGKTLTENKAFNPYFHTGHKFYGAMDYYFVGNPHKGAGLSDNYIKFAHKLPNTTLQIVFHQFFTPNNITDVGYNYSKNLGQECDVTVTYKINKFASIVGGYSFYLSNNTTAFLKGNIATNTTTQSIIDSKDIAYQQWFWLSINVSPTMLISNF
ncbi:MAG: alginate export family protein [Bacteroidia bacterium]|nr:alginate export family protein [Bacteroidia bacterium]